VDVVPSVRVTGPQLAATDHGDGVGLDLHSGNNFSIFESLLRMYSTVVEMPHLHCGFPQWYFSVMRHANERRTLNVDEFDSVQ
jgi:hypothetical protein